MIGTLTFFPTFFILQLRFEQKMMKFGLNRQEFRKMIFFLSPLAISRIDNETFDSQHTKSTTIKSVTHLD